MVKLRLFMIVLFLVYLPLSFTLYVVTCFFVLSTKYLFRGCFFCNQRLHYFFLKNTKQTQFSLMHLMAISSGFSTPAPLVICVMTFTCSTHLPYALLHTVRVANHKVAEMNKTDNVNLKLLYTHQTQTHACAQFLKSGAVFIKNTSGEEFKL
jgi:hypothetical protein